MSYLVGMSLVYLEAAWRGFEEGFFRIKEEDLLVRNCGELYQIFVYRLVIVNKINEVVLN